MGLCWWLKSTKGIIFRAVSVIFFGNGSISVMPNLVRVEALKL